MPQDDFVVFHMGYVTCQVGIVGGGPAEVDEMNVRDVVEIVKVVLGGVIDAVDIDTDVDVADAVELVEVEINSSVDVVGNEIDVLG